MLNLFFFYQADEVARSFERVHSSRMRDVDDGYIVDFEDDVVDLETAVDRRRPAGDDLCDADGWVVTDVGVVCAPGNAETQAGIASLQNYLFVVPTLVAIRLHGNKKRKSANET